MCFLPLPDLANVFDYTVDAGTLLVDALRVKHIVGLAKNCMKDGEVILASTGRHDGRFCDKVSLVLNEFKVPLHLSAICRLKWS